MSKGEEAGSSAEFTLSSTSTASDFTSRSQDIFGGLGNIEDKHFAKQRAKDKFGQDPSGKYIKDDPADDPTDPAYQSRRAQSTYHRSRSSHRDHDRAGSSSRDYDRSRSGSRDLRHSGRDLCDSRRDYYGRDTTRSRNRFKVPNFRAPRSICTPDYKMNPEKWTSYDLSDVSSDQMSDKSNSAAAFQFLQERRVQRENEENKTSYNIDLSREPVSRLASVTEDKVIFKKPTKSFTFGTKTKDTSEKGCMKFVGGKCQMAEYVVGSKPAAKKKKWRHHDKSSSVCSGEKVGLQHLGGDEEEEYSSDELSDLSDMSDEEGEKLIQKPKKSSKVELQMKPEPELATAEFLVKQHTATSTQDMDSPPEKIVFKSGKGSCKTRGMRKRKNDEEDN